jgi:preprotein translocase subunit Sec61beta
MGLAETFDPATLKVTVFAVAVGLLVALLLEMAAIPAFAGQNGLMTALSAGVVAFFVGDGLLAGREA